MAKSKQLISNDTSGFEFAKEMLNGDVTAAINFDRIQKHPTRGYIIFEYLLCNDTQKHVTPHSSHPKYYWDKNSREFLSLWEIAKDLKSNLIFSELCKKRD